MRPTSAHHRRVQLDDRRPARRRPYAHHDGARRDRDGPMAQPPPMRDRTVGRTQASIAVLSPAAPGESHCAPPTSAHQGKYPWTGLAATAGRHGRMPAAFHAEFGSPPALRRRWRCRGDITSTTSIKQSYKRPADDSGGAPPRHRYSPQTEISVFERFGTGEYGKTPLSPPHLCGITQE
jgi:hypothetical protein